MTSEMTPRERVRAALNHQEPDRVPIALGQATGDGITLSAYRTLLRHLGMDESRARLKELAVAAGVADQVGFLGRISDDELDAEFAASMALLCTSRIEGFGLPGVEALLRGVPVIAVDTPAARETVGSAATLVESNAEAIAHAMAAPVAVPDAARLALAERFSLGATADALWAVYEPVL
jgi:glycosyltransferase involved in cell wall biosynthesis